MAESRHFARSPKLREFLLYVAERSLAGHAEEVTEIEVARRVFARSANFVPTEDSVVRGAARQLRIKIKEYFDAEGAPEPWRMEIPKGAYLPVFTKLPEPPPAFAATLDPPARKPWMALSLAGNALLILLCSWVWLHRPAADPPAHRNVITEMLQLSPGNVSLIYSDFSLAVMRSLAPNGPERLSVDDYARWDYSSLQPPASSDAITLRAFDLFLTHRLTRSGDLSLATQIVRFDSANHRIFVRDARDVTARDFRSGSHILLGNPNSTPWTELFEPGLGLRWVRGKGYHDETPAPGKSNDYFTPASTYNETGPGYARIALLPNLADDNHVLLIGGVNMVTMEAAGNFVLDPHHWDEIRKALALPVDQPAPYFEALLETKAVDNTPQSAILVFARRLRR